MKAPHNFEQAEAEQAEINKERLDAYKGLSPSEKLKADAVDTAIRTLTDAGVTAVLFANVKLGADKSPHAVIQFNNIKNRLMSDSLIPNAEEVEKLKNFNEVSCLAMHKYMNFFLRRCETNEEKLQVMNHFMDRAVKLLAETGG